MSFTCVSIDYAESPEDWRPVEDFFGRIRNCGESGGHTKSDACSMYTHLIGGLSVEGSGMW